LYKVVQEYLIISDIKWWAVWWAKEDQMLKAKEIEHAKPGMHADGNGLYLRVQNSGAKGWIFRFQLNGRRREMGLGILEDKPVVDARTEVHIPPQTSQPFRLKTATCSDGLSATDSNGKTATDSNKKPASLAGSCFTNLTWLAIRSSPHFALVSFASIHL
jgi:hypothetical protein